MPLTASKCRLAQLRQVDPDLLRQLARLGNNLNQLARWANRDQRYVQTTAMLGFKVFHSAATTVAGIETAHMIRKDQFGQTGTSAFKQIVALAG